MGIRLLNEQKRDVLWALFNLPVMFTSSVFYDIEQAPSAIRVLGRLNPLTHCTDILRACMFGATGQVAWRLGTVVGLALIATGGSLLLVHRTPLSRRSTR
jgi:ABC-type polysaccharide/polyol phosphate export permease